MIFNLVYANYAKRSEILYRVFLITEISIFALVILIWAANKFDNLFNIILSFSPLILLFTILYVRSYIDYRLVKSEVKLSDDGILVYYKNRCWREIKYDQIKSTEIRSIKLSYYGPKGVRIGEADLKYLLIVLGDEIEEIEDFSCKNFKNKNFFIIHYNEEMINCLNGKLKNFA